MQQDSENFLQSKKCSIVNTLIDLLESKNKFDFKFSLNFVSNESSKSESLQILKLPCRLVDDYFNRINDLNDKYRIITDLNFIIKKYLLNLKLKGASSQSFDRDRDSYLVELVEDLDENENTLKTYSETVSTSLLNESFGLIEKYGNFADCLVDQIFDDVGKVDFQNAYIENEIEINIKIPDEKVNQNYNLQKRRHSMDEMSYRRIDSINSTLPNIAEDSLSDTDLCLRRHSFKNKSGSIKLNRTFKNPMPTIIVDFEEENECKSSSRTSLDKSKLTDSDNELNHNQFKQYTKVTLKNVLNISPTSNKEQKNEVKKDQLVNENLIRNSNFLNKLVNEVVSESSKETMDILKLNSTIVNSLADSVTNEAFEELKQVKSLNKIDHVYFECDCVNMENSLNQIDPLNCKMCIYLILILLEDFNYNNLVTFKCSSY